MRQRISQIIKGIEHIGLTVPDIEQATEFYQQAFGARVSYDILTPDMLPKTGPEAEETLDLPFGTSIDHIRMLHISGGLSLELFHVNASDQNSCDNLVDLGYSHAAFYTADMAAAIRRIVRAGGTLLSNPIPMTGPRQGRGNCYVFGRTPWNSLFELVTCPSGIRQNVSGAEARRNKK